MHQILAEEKGYNTNISRKHNYLLPLLSDLRKYWYFIIYYSYQNCHKSLPLLVHILPSYARILLFLFSTSFSFLFSTSCLFPFFFFISLSLPFLLSFLYFLSLAFPHRGEVASAAAIQRREGIETLGPRFLSAPARIPKTSACGDLRG